MKEILTMSNKLNKQQIIIEKILNNYCANYSRNDHVCMPRDIPCLTLSTEPDTPECSYYKTVVIPSKESDDKLNAEMTNYKRRRK
jgi:hypothetical protein